MNKQAEERSQLLRREASDMFARDRMKESEVVKEREKAFAAQAQKTTRLRAARLAREADDRAVLAAAEAAKPPVVPKKKRAKTAKAG